MQALVPGLHPLSVGQRCRHGFQSNHHNIRQPRPGEHHDGWNLDFLTEFLRSKFNVTYSTGQASSLLGEMGGTMLDWVYEDLGVGRAYALELVRLGAKQGIFSQEFSGCQGEETPLCLFQCPVKVARCLSPEISKC